MRPSNVGLLYVHFLSKLIKRSRGGRTTFFSNEVYDWIPYLESKFSIIRGELDSVLLKVEEIPNFQDIQIEQRDLTEGEDWKTLIFYGYSEPCERNLKRCPETAAILESIPGLKSAMFSILKPGKHIPPHEGPYNGVLRVHLGLIIPDGDCGIRVGDEESGWAEGRCLVFDDTFDHEAWNFTDERRAVLFLDIERPLAAPLSYLNRLAIHIIRKSSFIQAALERLEEHHENLSYWDPGRLRSIADFPTRSKNNPRYSKHSRPIK